MRDSRRFSATVSRRQRRALLAMIILASSPIMAEPPSAVHQVRILPPLPLKPIQGTEVHINPFCELKPNQSPTDVQLASGSKSTSIRLKPIGAAIGLHSIEKNASAHISRPAITIEKVAPPVVRKNPLVGSIHHENRELIDTEVDDRSIKTPVVASADVADETVAPQRNDESALHDELLANSGSSIVLIRPKTVQPSVVQNQPDSAQAANPEGFPPLSIAPPNAFSSAAAEQPATPAEMEATRESAAPTDLDQPIMFSLTDQLDPFDASAHRGESEADPVDQTPPDQQLATKDDWQESDPQPWNAAAETDVDRLQPDGAELADHDGEPSDLDAGLAELDAAAPLVADDGLKDAAQSAPDPMPSGEDQPTTERVAADATPAANSPPLPDPVEIAVDGSLRVGNAEYRHLTDEDGPASRLQPIESVINEHSQLPIAIYRSEPETLDATVPQPSASTRRYRPPVAVKEVPIAFKRTPQDFNTTAESMVQAAGELHLDHPKPVATGKLTPLFMSRAQVRSLTLGGELRGVQVADKNVCEAVASGPNQLKLIGTGNGVTQLVVWADTPEAGTPTRVRAFEIHVKDTVETTGQSIGNKIQLLNQSIRKAFPRCSAQVQTHRGQLIVTGRCDGEDSAKQIIRMVRRTCLIPVQDQLVVQ